LAAWNRRPPRLAPKGAPLDSFHAILFYASSAVAVGMASGPAAALELVDTLAKEPALKTYHFLPSVRADLLKKLSRVAEARVEFERAASLTRNTRERDLLLERAAQCASESAESPKPKPARH